MEQVFPLLFVEQRRGWAGIQAQMPYFSAVADVKRRAIEFLLNLDAGRSDTRRQELRAREAELQAEWRVEVQALQDAVSGNGLAITGVPAALTLSWPGDISPATVQSDGDGWLPIEAAIQRLRTEIAIREAQPVPTVDETAPEAEQQLNEAISSLDEVSRSISDVSDRISREEQAISGLEAVIASLREDLREHQDVLILRGLGGEALGRLHDDCPVCHQPLPDALLESARGPVVLSPEQTIEHIRSQVDLFETMRADGGATVDALTEQLRALQHEAHETRAQVRALRTTLTSAGQAPSVAFVQQLVSLRDRLDRLERLDERFLRSMGSLERIVERARDVRQEVRELPADTLSPSDQRKLNLLESSFVTQLHEYEFGSFADEQLNISAIDYLPRRADFDLQADISASDSIRVVWAYLLGLLEVAAQTETNHPGLLIFDEPRQQSAADVSFAALLRRAADATGDRQVIFATSEPLDDLQHMLAGQAHSLEALDGYLLRAIREP